jgi:hypothetical protein
MVYFQTKNLDLGKFLGALLHGKMLISFMASSNILLTFEKFYDHLVHFVLTWYIIPVLVSCVYREKSGNPVKKSQSGGLLSQNRQILSSDVNLHWKR